MFTCNGTKAGITRPHQHESSIEGRRCYGWATLPAPATVTVPGLPTDTATAKQLEFIKSLGGDVDYACTITRKAASAYIDRLKTQGGKPVTAATQTETDPRLKMAQALLDLVPDGYFATQAEEGAVVTFMRISSPKSGQFKGCRKIQSQHGPRLENSLIYWPSGRWTIFRGEGYMIDQLMLAVADYKGSMMRYAEKLNHCCRCNTELTDPRSRYYGIGPDCEEMMPWVVARKDEQDGPWAGGR